MNGISPSALKSRGEELSDSDIAALPTDVTFLSPFVLFCPPNTPDLRTVSNSVTVHRGSTFTTTGSEIRPK